jgi:thymidylate synthase
MSIISQNFSSAYREALELLYTKPDYMVKPRDSKIHELMNQSLVIQNPISCIYSNEHRGSQTKYIGKELLYYFSGRNDVDWISKQAPFWNNVANEDGTINSAYGYLIFQQKNEYDITPYQWALNSLEQDRDTRQSIIHFNKPRHQRSKVKDQVCTMYGIFHIRDNKLHFTVHMRSNDVIKGTPIDIPFFTTLQRQMLSHLQQIAMPSLELGTYTHHANSLHLYSDDFDKVGNMLEHQFSPKYLDQAFTDFVYRDGTPTFTETLEQLENEEHNYSLNNDNLFNWALSKLKKH